MSETTVIQKPKLRGYIHQEAFFVAMGASILLIAKSTGERAIVASVIYSAGLLFLFGCSAIYHRFHWQPKMRSFIQRFDHSAIFIFIASTTTPVAMFALPPEMGHRLLITIWTAAFIGTVQSILWVGVPKWVMALLCVITGWLSFPYMAEFGKVLSPGKISLLISGGVIYSVGAIFYAMKKPSLWPNYFGYHELFHLCTIVAASFHFSVIYQLIS
jgi:hemolysin III